MAVVTLYMSDRDPSQQMFKSKKEADEHDKKLELAEGVSHFLAQRLTSLNEGLAEEIGMLVANHKEAFATAFKGKVDVLFEESPEPAPNAEEETKDNAKVKESGKVRAIAGKG
ncbi:uncharacterized protein conserved in bacteria [Hahella chejuensis KCTC 2396]|uniref:Uncharacterized protein conserved in bacteria n=1 Tax=Hahella chejuensis (strain KCTC 2396) TaxID=349521 RepID=Q2SBZ6_HAHCH|nr:YebG family protein [Hahella chejuensis]ABC31828.1 uncharacterized protein conserved in bacteria [Hahella chejuensis KCTC 2396]